MEFRQIQYFVCLYEEGSVTRAARRLNIVQPALSMQLTKLEDELGQRLFNRSPQGMQPTAEARRLYRLFMPVMTGFARAKEQAIQPSGELSGPVRVGMIASIAQEVMVEALLAFSTAHPKVELCVTDGFSGTLVDAVAIGQLDAAVINKPRRPLALQTELIAEEDVLLVCGPRHPPLAASLTLADVASLRLVLPSRQHGLRGIIESFVQAEDIHLNPSAEIDSIGAIIKLVQVSDFCTLLPRIAVRQLLENGILAGHVVSRPHLVRQIVSVTDARRPLGPASAAFVATLAGYIRGTSTPTQGT